MKTGSAEKWALNFCKRSVLFEDYNFLLELCKQFFPSTHSHPNSKMPECFLEGSVDAIGEISDKGNFLSLYLF